MIIFTSCSFDFLQEILLGNINYLCGITRRIRPEMFCKKVVLKDFAKFTGKHLCQSLFFYKVQGLNFIKKGTFFLRTLFKKFLRTLLLQIKHLQWLLLDSRLLLDLKFDPDFYSRNIGIWDKWCITRVGKGMLEADTLILFEVASQNLHRL